MKYVNNEHASHDPHMSARSDRGTFLHQRAQTLGLIAIPCLLIIVGVGLGPLTLPWITLSAFLAILLSFVLFNAYFLKDNPRLKKASRWILGRSYQESVMGLDEREKLVIDQAFRTSYRIFAMIFNIVALCLYINMFTFHLAYRLGFSGGICIFGGIVCFLQFLPATVVAWHERGWVQ